jgi:hypothetical protein
MVHGYDPTPFVEVLADEHAIGRENAVPVAEMAAQTDGENTDSSKVCRVVETVVVGATVAETGDGDVTYVPREAFAEMLSATDFTVGTTTSKKAPVATVSREQFREMLMPFAWVQ